MNGNKESINGIIKFLNEGGVNPNTGELARGRERGPAGSPTGDVTGPGYTPC